MDFFTALTGILICLGILVILPIILLFLILRKKIMSEKNKKEIILAALEKNADINIEELVKKMNAPDKLIKEKLLRKFQWGLLTFILGCGFIAYAYMGSCFVDMEFLVIVGAAFLAVGVSLLCTYQYGKKMLAKEMETEEQNLCQA